MSIHKLSTSDFESDYTLIAIHSQSEPYKLAYEINLKLNTSLKKSSFDISFKNKTWFSSISSLVSLFSLSSSSP